MGQTALGGARRTLAVALVVCAGALALLAPSAHAARGFETGIYEPDYTSDNSATQTTAFDQSVQARAGFTLIYVDWSRVAPSDPVGFVPTNPADPNYNWDDVDAAVRDAAARGLKVILGVTR